MVGLFYARAAADIADYFRDADREQLQRHFLAVLIIVTGQGVTVGLVRRLRRAHAGVCNSRGTPITADVWDTVIGVLAGVLIKFGTPPAALAALAATVAPIRAAIVTQPGADAR